MIEFNFLDADVLSCSTPIRRIALPWKCWRQLCSGGANEKNLESTYLMKAFFIIGVREVVIMVRGYAAEACPDILFTELVKSPASVVPEDFLSRPPPRPGSLKFNYPRWAISTMSWEQLAIDTGKFIEEVQSWLIREKHQHLRGTYFPFYKPSHRGMS
jgi:hypothetical protein